MGLLSSKDGAGRGRMIAILAVCGTVVVGGALLVYLGFSANERIESSRPGGSRARDTLAAQEPTSSASTSDEAAKAAEGQRVDNKDERPSASRSNAVWEESDYELVEWKLSDPEVIREGRTIESPRGSLMQGRVVQATARATLDGKPAVRRFVVTLTLFGAGSSAQGGAGGYRLSGLWELRPLDRTGRPRDRSRVQRGTLGGSFGSDPLAGERDVVMGVAMLRSDETSGGQRPLKGEYRGSAGFLGTFVAPQRR